MKLTNLKSIALLAFAGSALLTTAAHAGTVKNPSTAANGDILLGVRATGGTGVGLDVVVDLGPINSSSADDVYSTGGLATALTSAFGSDWATRTDLQVGAVGTTGPVATLPAVAKTLFATNARVDAGTPSTPWITSSATTQGGVSSQILTAQNQFKSSSSTSAVTQGAFDSGSWATFLSGGSSFGYFNPSIEGTPSQVLDLFVLAPNAAEVAAARLGTLKLNADATVTFTSQATIDTPADLSKIDFAAPVVTAARGAASVSINLVRTGGTAAVSATVTATSGTATVTGSTVASFGANQNSTGITLTVPVNTAISGKQFTITLSGANVGTSYSTATVILPGIETGLPYLSVTAPLATASITGSTAAGNLSVVGSTNDDMGISTVLVKVNNGAFKALTLTSTTGNIKTFNQLLSGVLDIVNGLNTVTIRAVDTSGNTADIVRHVRYTAKGNLTFAATGTTYSPITGVGGLLVGALAPSTAGAYQVGNLYTVTAKQFDVVAPAVPTDSSKVFSGWLVGNNPTLIPGLALTFTMTTDLLANPTITAVYVPSPFVSSVIGGTYTGLVTNNAGYASTNATNGYITVTLSSKGALTGSIKLNGLLLTLVSGSLANDGTVLFGATPALQVPYARFTTSPVIVTLKFDFATKTLSGFVYDTTNVSSISAALSAGSATAGTYTFTLPTASASALTAAGLTRTTFPQGSSIGTVTVNAAGVVTVSMTTADTKLPTQSTFLRADGTFPLYVSPYGATAVTAGSLSGVVTIGAVAGAQLSAPTIKWFRPASVFTASGSYAAGWPNGVSVALTGAVYSSAASPLYTGAAVGNTASFYLDASSSTADLTNVVDVAGSVFTMHTTGTLTVKPLFTAATGVVSGTRGTFPFKGVIIQGGTTPGVYGYYSTGTTTAAGKQGFFKLVP